MSLKGLLLEFKCLKCGDVISMFWPTVKYPLNDGGKKEPVYLSDVHENAPNI